MKIGSLKIRYAFKAMGNAKWQKEKTNERVPDMRIESGIGELRK